MSYSIKREKRRHEKFKGLFGWDLAIAQIEDKIDDLRSNIKFFKSCKEAGDPPPAYTEKAKQ